MSYLSEQEKINNLFRVMAIDEHHKSEVMTSHILALIINVDFAIANTIFLRLRIIAPAMI